MLKFFTILVALVAAWFSVMLLGCLLVQAVRLGASLLGGLAARTVLVGRALGRPLVRWAERRTSTPAAGSAGAVVVLTDDAGGFACGHENRAGARFCGRCGAARDAAATSPALPPAPPHASDGIVFLDESGPRRSRA